MQALLNILNPVANLTSLRHFYDTIEIHVRGLAALGKSEESFGSLLVPIILGKLPTELQRALAREQNNFQWTINLSRQAILKEVTILEDASQMMMPLQYTVNRTPHPSQNHSIPE